MPRKNANAYTTTSPTGKPKRPDHAQQAKADAIQRQLHNAWVGRFLGAAPQDLRPATGH